MVTTQKIFLFIIILATVCACQNDKNKKPQKQEKSYRKFIDRQTEILGKPANYYKNLELTYLYDLDTISKDSFLAINFDSIYNIFQEVDFKYISPDSFKRKVTLNTVSINYYKNHTFKPSFLDVSYYSDNLLGLNLGSKEHGNMKCEMYDNATGVKLSGFTKDTYKGSFFLGSMTKHDTFEEVRMILKIDTLIYEQTYLTKDIDQRTIVEDLEK